MFDVFIALVLVVAVIIYGALFYRAVLDCRRGFPNSIDNIDKVKNRYLDRYYL